MTSIARLRAKNRKLVKANAKLKLDLFDARNDFVELKRNIAAGPVRPFAHDRRPVGSALKRTPLMLAALTLIALLFGYWFPPFTNGPTRNPGEITNTPPRVCDCVRSGR